MNLFNDKKVDIPDFVVGCYSMKVIRNKISIDVLEKMAEKMFGNLVKAVVDVEKKIMAINGGLHSDEEALLLRKGSKQKNLSRSG